MKAHRIIGTTAILFLGWVIQAQATGRTRPDQYPTATLQAAEDQINGFKKGNVGPKDLVALSEKMHGVTVLNVPPTDEDSERVVPQGTLQLDKVVIVDPKSN